MVYIGAIVLGIITERMGFGIMQNGQFNLSNLLLLAIIMLGWNWFCYKYLRK